MQASTAAREIAASRGRVGLGPDSQVDPALAMSARQTAPNYPISDEPSSQPPAVQPPNHIWPSRWHARTIDVGGAG
jgi:hypothetical protein